jgi:hypothetical protein
MGSCFRVASSQHDSHPFQTTVKIKVAQHHVVLINFTMCLRQKTPNIVFEQAKLPSSPVELMSMPTGLQGRRCLNLCDVD